MLWFAATIIILAGLAAVPAMLEMRRFTPDPDYAPGDLLPLPAGDVHYRWHGGARGKVIVAIHGLSTPSPVWEALSAQLVQIGYRVLVYDLYGRGFSASPRGKQDERFFNTQLEGLLEHLGLTEDLTLMGYSMGGSIATAFAAANPHLVSRVILIAPAGMALTEKRRHVFQRRVLLLGDWVAAVIEPWLMAREIAPAPPALPGIDAVQRAELSRQGFQGAVLASRRGMLTQSMEPAHKALARTGIPVVAFWGETDRVIPLRALGKLTEWNRSVKHEVIPGATHALPASHPDELGAKLAEVLRER